MIRWCRKRGKAESRGGSQRAVYESGERRERLDDFDKGLTGGYIKANDRIFPEEIRNNEADQASSDFQSIPLAHSSKVFHPTSG